MNEWMMVPTGPDLLTNAHTIAKMYLEISNFWEAGDECIFFFLWVPPCFTFQNIQTLKIRLGDLDDIPFSFYNSDI